MPVLEFAKRVADPIHGTIPLTAPEVQILGAGSLLRLQEIKHLGMAYLVYPGADFSRFAHSLGVCHVTGRILNAIRKPLQLKPRDVQLYRLAALLHDVGHYPFSHLAERAAQNHYQRAVIRGAENGATAREPAVPVFNHERAGREVVEKDPQIVAAIKRLRLRPRDITALFMHEKVGGGQELPSLTNIISSDLDADRLDYLQRMAHNTGLPYGSIDLDYLISQMVCDSRGQASVTMKALRTVEHFLLQRLFAYQQIAYHKTVAAFEQVMEQVLEMLLDRQLLDCSADWVSGAIESGEWRQFNDGMVMDRIAQLAKMLDFEGSAHTKVMSILKRKPPKLLFSTEFFGERGDESGFLNVKKAAEVLVGQLSEKFSVPLDLFYVWSPPPVALTKVGARVPIALEAMPQEEIDQSIRMVEVAGGESKKVQELKRSLLRPLSEQMLFALRIYMLPPADWPAKKVDEAVPQMRELIPALNPLMAREA